MITFDHVTKTFAGGTTAVDDLTLTVEQGQFAVFVGPSGCGKTTSMRMINRMVEPSSGAITVAGKDVSRTNAVQLRLGIGYVIQHAGLLPHRTVLDNVATVLFLKGVQKKQARATALQTIERVGLDPALAGRYPSQLSGGQQQRVGVARALAADPPVLLMDEPFSAVDAVVRDELQAEMLRLQAELNKTIVFVTHDIDEAVKVGDKIAVFGAGGVLQQFDEPETVLTAPANEFVASLVGRDRGFRSLSFHAPGERTLSRLPTTTVGARHQGGWAVVVDDAYWPLGWVHGTIERVAEEDIISSGTVARTDSSLRQLLDAALSSPGGVGVVVDTDGVLAGGIHAEEVLREMREQRDLEITLPETHAEPPNSETVGAVSGNHRASRP
ncbi:MAG: proline/glycine betaine ABC transporter ATP-binding protein [Micrococcales bacterium]|nr:MAG: proline/glycine betaine ABC transporter ATP-binding protein [Micrococcales bacterium]PIE26939.1 MAG: proline/glycine betaine ABC transporter ATP-binding protein [Micrococcales bacterium]